MSIEKNTSTYLRHSGLGFTTIINQTMDLIPDMGALGIYCYLASKPEGWIIREVDLMKRFGCGRDAIRSKMKILKSIGLITKEAIKDAQGKVKHWDTTLHNHITGNPPSGETTLLETHLHSNKGVLQIKERNINEPLSVSEKPETRPSNPANTVMKEYIDVWNDIAEQQHMVPVNEEDKKAVTKAAVMVNKLLKSWPTINASKLTQIKANAALTPDYLKRILLTAIDTDWFMLCAKDSVHDIATILAEKNFIKMLIAINKSRSLS